MPETRLATNVAEIVAHHTTANNEWLNIYHILCPARPSADDLTTLATAYTGWAADVGVGHWNADTQVTKVHCRDLTAADGAEIDLVPDPVIVGTRPSGVLPLNATFCLKKMSGMAGRSNRGRLYVGGLTEDVLDDSGQALNNSNANGLVEDYTALISAFEGAIAGAEFGLVSWRHDGAPRDPGLFVHTPTLGYTDLFVDSQRRRLPGHNRHR